MTHAAWPIMRAKAYGRVVVDFVQLGHLRHVRPGELRRRQARRGGPFMHALRLEGQKYNISINALAPVAATRMTESLMTPEALAQLRPEFVSPMVA